MAVALRQSRRFDASSPVTRYWLANCIGFSVVGRDGGTVVRVLADDDPHAPSVLEVQVSRRRLRRVPTSAVVAVVPSDRLLVVERRRQKLPPLLRHLMVRLRWTARILRRQFAAGVRRAAPVGATARQKAREGARRAAPVGAAAWRKAREGSRRTAPVVARAGRSAGAGTVTLVRSVPWQRSGRFARSATTRLWRARSRPSSRRRTTSSAPSSEESSVDEARSTSST